MDDLRCTETFRDGLSPLGGRQTYGGGCQTYSQPLVCRAYKVIIVLFLNFFLVYSFLISYSMTYTLNTFRSIFHMET